MSPSGRAVQNAMSICLKEMLARGFWAPDADVKGFCTSVTEHLADCQMEPARPWLLLRFA
jgi:hypothetical protein